jgi:hypothetical protein
MFDGENGQLIVLDKVFRQRDGQFRQLLNDMRIGEVNPISNKILQDKMNEFRQKVQHQAQNTSGDAEIKPTKLFAVNSGVDAVSMRLNMCKYL